ncbi:MAG: FAD-dependent oxidoreductase, partial [Marinosulfonomonas sp.]|nr:FAD-dependent oxidoreductase [Marinosulfonomonas sp.]
MSHIVVVGAGQAGQALVCKLRELKFDGQITLIGEEPVPPYQRPPLSKDYLLGKTDVERLYLRPLEYYGEHDITLRLGQKVTGVDAVNKTVQVAGEEISYDHLALTTGAIPHRLPAAIGGDLKGLHVVRTLADVDQMEPEFQAGRNVLIVGGGYIGLEAAAVAARKGLNVTLVEMADRILQRVAARETSDFVRATHEKEGVTIREGVGLKQLNGDGTVQSATLSDGSELPVDFVIVGVGVAPATEVAQMAGLTLDNGICTNELGQTSDPSIWSAGDCASFP